MKQLTKRFAAILLSLIVAASFASTGGLAFAADDVDGGATQLTLSTAQVQGASTELTTQADAQDASRSSVVPVFSGLPSETSMTEDLTSFSYYSDSLFANDASIYNDDLAYASVNLAAAADNSNTGGTDYASKARNIKRYLADIGCQDVQANDGYNYKPATKSNIGVAIGNKVIRVNGQDYRLFVFGVRGGGYEREWAPNLKIGTSGDHQGFQEARDAALAFILPYIQSHVQANEKVKIWASGYCRGGVVANMACAWLDKWIYERNHGSSYRDHDASYRSDYKVRGKAYDETEMAFLEDTDPFNPKGANAYIDSSVQFSEHDVYCYPVNNPQASTKTDVEAHKDLVVGIHNLINPDDWFPQVTMGWDDWNFARYGTDHDLTRTYGNSSFANRDKSILETNPQGVKDTLARLKKLNPDASYTTPEFRQYYFAKLGFTVKVDEKGEGNQFVSKNTELKYNQGKYFEEFFRFLLKAVGCEQRGQFDSIQADMIYFMDLTMGAPIEVRDRLGAVMKKHALAEFKRVTDIDIDSIWGKLKLLGSIDGWMSDKSDVVDQILNGTLEKGLTELGIAYDKTKLAATVASLSKIVKGAYKDEQKIGYLNFYHLVTMMKSGSGVSQAHFPEVTLSWWPTPQKKNVVRVDASGQGQGTVSGEGLYATGETAKLIATPNGSSTFVGWYKNDEKISEAATFDLGVQSDSLVKAQFALKPGEAHTLTVDANGGKFEGSQSTYTENVEANKLLPTLKTPTKDSSTFIGWTTAQDDANTLIDTSSYTMPNKDLMLYAFWAGATPELVTVTFDNNSTEASGTMQPQYIDKGKTGILTANAFTRTGYDFAGWNTASDGSGTAYADKASFFAKQDTTLYAQWTPSVHEIGFRLEGGSLPEAITRSTGEEFGTLPNPKELMEWGEYVKNWRLVDDKGAELAANVTSDSEVPASDSKELTLVAETDSLPSRTLRFFKNLDDKQVASDADLVLETPVYKDGRVRIAAVGPDDENPHDEVAIKSYAAPERDGYSFIGWSTKPDASGIPQVYVSPDSIIWYNGLPDQDVIELYAVWAKSEMYEFDYDANGGTSPQGSQVVEYQSGEDGTFSTAANPFTRADFVFAGWNTKADGSGTAIAANASYTAADLGLPAYNDYVIWLESTATEEEFDAALQAGTLTLYAQWEPALPTVKPKLAAKPKASKKTVTLSWDAVAGATGYTVEWRQLGKKKWKSVTTAKQKYTVKKLKVGKCYQFRIRATDGTTTSAWSSVAYRFMKNTTKVKAKASGKKKVTVAWKRTPGATGYRILCSTSKKMTNAKTYKVGKGKTTKRTIKHLKSGKRYYVKVIPIKKKSGKVYLGAESARVSAKAK